MQTQIENDISAVIKARLDAYRGEPSVYDVGTVTRSSDGVVQVSGLPGRRNGELLAFEGGVYGMTLDLRLDGVGAVLLSSDDKVSIGSQVTGTGRVVEVPQGNVLLGRVLDPIGRPLDGEPLNARRFRPVEQPAPGLIQRQKVDQPLMTGILSIDAMIPIGKGQRELIIGDRQTGKTAIALDAILSQKNNNVVCVYCAIGQKASAISQIVNTLRQRGAMEYCIVVAATAGDGPAMQYIAPYAACSIAEGFMYEGRDVLVVYDDLSKHAVAYRALSLLLHRPPGREAYPGDVFYLHSRLLERSAHLSADLGGGSITALPIIETLGGDISAYIPTNVISITDGQIFLESELFNSGMRPAVNVGLSVSRVGRSAQYPAMKKMSGTLRIELAQFRELAVFAQFGSDIDASTKKMLDKGARLTEILKQEQYSPRPLSWQVALLLASAMNAFTEIETGKTRDFSREMMEYLHKHNRLELSRIDRSGDLSDVDREALTAAIESFKEVWHAQSQ
jgi:F-type H+-transporting ATPase subunit alpha